MRKTKKNQNSQRGAALVEAALTIALVGVVCIQAVGQLGDRTADKMCNNAAKVHYSNDDTQVNALESIYFYDKSELKCCTLSPPSGRFANTGSVCI